MLDRVRLCAMALLLGMASITHAQESSTAPSDAAETPPSSSPETSEPTQPAGSADQTPEASGSSATAPPDLQVIPVLPEQEAAAESDAPTQLEEIVVTATKHIKSQRDIAGSVSAVSGNQLEAMHAQGLKDYLKLVPGVTFLDQGADEGVITIRGIGTQTGTGANIGTGSQTAAQTTGIFLDDLPFTGVFIPLAVPDINPFDLDRVEVLKGPQGTLFGGTALAGAIRYIVHRPDLGVWSGKFSQTVSDTKDGGGFGQVTAGAVNVPLGDSFALRAVAIRRRDQGLYDQRAFDNNGNVLRNDENADKLQQDTGRLLASWNPPIDNLEFSAFYFIQKTHQNDEAISDDPENLRTGDTVGSPFPSPRIHDFDGGNFLATYDLGWGQLLSTTNRYTQDNWIDAHIEKFEGLDHQNQNEFFGIGANQLRGFTQELRLSSPEGGIGPWEWTVGVSYLNERMRLWTYFHAGEDIPDPRREDQVTQAQRQADALFFSLGGLATEQALFGSVTRRLGEHFEVTGGGRVFRNHLAADITECGAVAIAVGAPPTCATEMPSTSAKGFNPDVALRFILTRNVQAFVRVAKGFQFGGFQPVVKTSVVEQSAQEAGHPFEPYKSSTLWNYETGIRTDWLNRRLRFDLTAFLVRWKDMQFGDSVPLGGNQVAGRTAVAITQIINVGRAHSKGVEASLAVIPFSDAQWISNAVWMSAATDVVFGENDSRGPVAAGSTLPGAAHFQWSNVLSYQPFFHSWTIGPVLTHTHVGSSPDDLRPTGTVGGFDTLDARLDLTMVSSRYQPVLSFGVNNVTDVRGVTSHFRRNRLDDGTPFDLYHFVTPRTMTVNLSFQF